MNDLPRGQQLLRAPLRHLPRRRAAQATERAAPPCCPRPSNLAEHDYSTARLADVLWNGVVGTAMPAWRDHSAEDRAAMAQAVRALGASASRSRTCRRTWLELGARIYAANCVQCHGARGDGDGRLRPSCPWRRPASGGNGRALAHAIEVLRNGIDGTSMAPWTSRLTDAELVAVADYVRGFYAGALGASPADDHRTSSSGASMLLTAGVHRRLGRVAPAARLDRAAEVPLPGVAGGL